VVGAPPPPPPPATTKYCTVINAVGESVGAVVGDGSSAKTSCLSSLTTAVRFAMSASAALHASAVTTCQ